MSERQRRSPPSRSGGRLWALRKGSERRHAVLLDRGPWGIDVQVFANGEFLSGRRYPSRALAVARAEEERQQRLADGWR